MDEKNETKVDVDELINEICSSAAKFTAFLNEEDQTRLQEIVSSLRSGKIRNIPHFLAEHGHALFKSNRKALRFISFIAPSLNKGLPQPSVVRNQKEAYIILSTLIPDSVEAIARTLSRPLLASEIPLFLEKSGRRVWEEVGIDDIQNDNVLHLAVSYRHHSHWNEKGTFSRQAIRKISLIINQIMSHSKINRVRLWVDQNVHVTGISDKEWYKIGLLPYLCMRVICGYRKINQTDERPWLWVEAEAAMISNGLYAAGNDGVSSKVKVRKSKEVQKIGKEVRYFQGGSLQVDDCLKLLLSEISCWRTRNFDYNNYPYLDEFDDFALWSAKECSRLILEDINWVKFENQSNREPSTLRKAREIWRYISQIRELAKASIVLKLKSEQRWKVNEMKRGAVLLFGHPLLENVPFSVFGAVDGHSNRISITNEFSQILVVKENDDYYRVYTTSKNEIIFSREGWCYSMVSMGLLRESRFALTRDIVYQEPYHYQYYITKSYIEAYDRNRRDGERIHNTIYGIKDKLVDFHGYIIPRMLKEYLKDYRKEKEFLSLSARAEKENDPSEFRYNFKKAIRFLTCMLINTYNIRNASADNEFEFDEPDEVIDCKHGTSILETRKRPPFVYILCYDSIKCNVARINILEIEKNIRSIRFLNCSWKPSEVNIIANRIRGKKAMEISVPQEDWGLSEISKILENDASGVDKQAWRDIIGTDEGSGKYINL